MHIILVGASHGWRLFRSLKQISGYGITFTVTCLCVRGAKFADLHWPQTVKENDFLVVIPFGNDVINRKNINFDRKTGIIHLVKFVPYEKEHWKTLFTKLQEKLSDKNCKILVIDNFYRHFCCDTHRHKGWLSYQTQVNKKLREQFKGSEIKVIDHRYLLNDPRIVKANVLEYRKLQGDSVHFRDYSPIAKNLLKCIEMFF
jgi:stalled ribosome alternative rescue factor ArfA